MTTITEEKLQTDSVTQYWTKINILPQPKGKTTTDWKASADVLLPSPLFSFYLDVMKCSAGRRYMFMKVNLVFVILMKPFNLFYLKLYSTFYRQLSGNVPFR